MSDLPKGWELTTIGELAPVSYGKGLSAKQRVASGPVPVVGSAGVVGCHTEALVDGPAIVIGRKGNAGSVCLMDGPSWPIDTTYFMRVPEGVDRAFLAYELDHLQLGRFDSSTAIPSLRREDLESCPLRIPPQAEQERIVAAIEEYVSRLEAAEAAAVSAERRIKALERSIIRRASSTLDPPQHWQVVTVADVGAVGLGLQRSPKRHTGPNMRPYLRVANVFEDRIDDSDLMSMDMTDAEWERFKLRDGDVLLNEGQSPELLGRPAIYRGDPPEVAFTNSLIRFQAGDDVDPEWALLVFRSHMHTRRFMRESQITTNIAHLAAGRFKTVEFPVPPLNEQHARVTEARSQMEACSRLRSEVATARRRAAGLRRSVLAAAFSGKLVAHGPDDEPASVLLERIRTERRVTTTHKRTQNSNGS